MDAEQGRSHDFITLVEPIYIVDTKDASYDCNETMHTRSLFHLLEFAYIGEGD